MTCENINDSLDLDPAALACPSGSQRMSARPWSIGMAVVLFVLVAASYASAGVG